MFNWWKFAEPYTYSLYTVLHRGYTLMTRLFKNTIYYTISNIITRMMLFHQYVLVVALSDLPVIQIKVFTFFFLKQSALLFAKPV